MATWATTNRNTSRDQAVIGVRKSWRYLSWRQSRTGRAIDGYVAALDGSHPWAYANPDEGTKRRVLDSVWGAGCLPGVSFPRCVDLVFVHPARQLVITCTWAVDPQVVETNIWRPALVSRDVYAACTPLSVTLLTVLPAGSVAPMCRVQARPDLTVVVHMFAMWVPVTSIEPVPTRMLLPDTVDWPGGTLGSTSSSP